MLTGPNWARRYGTGNRRLCARPGCGAAAVATLRFQPTRREAWLVDLDDQRARTEGDLCDRHAAGLVLPRGWALHDERTSQRRRLQAVPHIHVEEAEPEVAREAEAEPEPNHDALIEAEPSATLEGELAEVLDAQTPLLKRAFQNVLPVDPEDQ